MLAQLDPDPDPGPDPGGYVQFSRKNMKIHSINVDENNFRKFFSTLYDLFFVQVT